MTSKLGMRTRMRLFAAALTAFTVLAIAVGLVRLHQLKDGMQTVYEDRVLPLGQLKAVSDAYAVKVVDSSHKAAHGSLSPAEALRGVREARAQIRSDWTAYMATAMDARERGMAAAAEATMATAEPALVRLETLLERADLEGLRAFTGQAMYPLMDPISDALAALVALQQQVAAQEYAAAQANYRQTVWLQAGLMGAALAVGMLAARWVLGWLARTLGGEPDHAARIASGIASGRLDQQIGAGAAGRDSVLGAMQRMQDQLRQVIGEIASASGSVAAASQQIAVGNQDLSARTESQSANLQQTAATMDRMASAVQDGAAVAAQARSEAQAVEAMATASAAAVARVVDTMSGIEAASRRIAEISSVIDGIAFQTNILALNAAVEAARAGEQGRGFAVVASEVRSLAQRAGEAARQINGLIAQSVEKVEAGSGQVGQAGASMAQLAGQVQAVSRLIQQLSQNASHYSGGIGEVNAAMVQLDLHTQQNTALVEESSAAAMGLSEQAQRLRETVAFFQLKPLGAYP